ncbi:hypothetical protein [Fusobacterium gastrosuis]|uniref:hypothetical protein n=1 Tax=Fusobacterium gastrosuis TaxID=1755100 RepID=UPI002A9FAAD1|nr:hypothetical protein [Fusobacterium gastrosuis]
MDIIDELKESYGNHFQNLFTKLMKQKYANGYQSTASNGAIGDLKVDGILDCNTAFAIYAPEVFEETKLVNKMKSDFSGFMNARSKGYWQNIEKYIFVIKTYRQGVTPRVLSLITDFNKEFRVEVLTMDDLEILSSSDLPFSKDGKLLNEFKNDMVKILEYIIKRDFLAEPFDIYIFDEIDILEEKWSSKTRLFSNIKINEIKIDIFENLINLGNILLNHGVHLLPNSENLVFRDSGDTPEKGWNLRNVLPNEINKIRINVRDLLDELWEIKQ